MGAGFWKQHERDRDRARDEKEANQQMPEIRYGCRL